MPDLVGASDLKSVAYSRSTPLLTVNVYPNPEPLGGGQVSAIDSFGGSDVCALGKVWIQSVLSTSQTVYVPGFSGPKLYAPLPSVVSEPTSWSFESYSLITQPDNGLSPASRSPSPFTSSHLMPDLVGASKLPRSLSSRSTPLFAVKV